MLGPRPGADGNGGDPGNRDGGPNSHDEGRGTARPKQSLRQREDEPPGRPRARPQADGKDGGQPSFPSSRAGKLLRLGRMRVPPCRRVLVVRMMMMGVALAMMVIMVMIVVVVVLVVVMGVAVVRVAMVRVIVRAWRHRGADGGGTVERMQERQERAPLHPQQSHADGDDER